MPLPVVALTESLRESGLSYFAKLGELRDAVSRWLEYVPSTFPHYTRHGVSHSDEIISELSQILFLDGNPKSPTATLSSVETYVLCAAAYLHDAGMVVSDREKTEILSSDAWRTWTSGEAGGARRWADLQAFRASSSSAQSAARHFVADVQTRFLIAEFVRRVHHVRVYAVLAEHHLELASCAFGDAALLHTIADVCAAHGLDIRELENPERYPDRRTIRGEQVNVRFMALLLRLGDLLDLSSERACPFLMAAASPLPVSSVGHWSQYQRIIHRVTAPDRIELTAECETQDEHRLLQDWCTWLVQETHAAQILMSRVARHAHWTPPEVSIEQPGATIQIRPAPGARYRPSRWTFELDATSVFDRLIRDVYQFPMVFVRELLQNALDASRTQMYSDLRSAGESLPSSPTRVPTKWRDRYPIVITVSEQRVRNELSGEDESAQVVSVEDVGTGMDADIIQRYLLQIGRSYYQSSEFLDRYPFVATSRFGIGFLSVFAVSDHVVVDTYAPSSNSGDGPILLRLSGPRAYLLTERGSRATAGTRVSVQLRERYEEEEIGHLLRHWCKAVEFPVILRTARGESRVEPESSRLVPITVVGAKGESCTVSVRSFRIEAEGIEGEVLVASLRDGKGESWAARYQMQELAKAHPPVAGRVLPQSWVALHGIDLAPAIPVDIEYYDWHGRTDSLYARVDMRGRSDSVSLARVRMERLRHSEDLVRALEPTYERILSEHLASNPLAQGVRGWEYRQALAKEFPLPTFWRRVSALLRVFRAQGEASVSIEELDAAPRVGLVVGAQEFRGSDPRTEALQAAGERDVDMAMVSSDFRNLSHEIRSSLLQDRPVESIRVETERYPVIVFGRLKPPLEPLTRMGRYGRATVYVVPFPTRSLLCLSLQVGYYHGSPFLLDEAHPYTAWIVRLVRASEMANPQVNLGEVRRFLSLLVDVADRIVERPEAVVAFIREWRTSASLPLDLRPPDIDFDPTWIGHVSPPVSRNARRQVPANSDAQQG